MAEKVKRLQVAVAEAGAEAAEVGGAAEESSLCLKQELTRAKEQAMARPLRQRKRAMARKSRKSRRLRHDEQQSEARPVTRSHRGAGAAGPPRRAAQQHRGCCGLAL